MSRNALCKLTTHIAQTRGSVNVLLSASTQSW